MPKQVDHEQRRQEIVAATWAALREVGIEGTTMRAIANRAGCTTGRLNHYFTSRDAILVAALRQVHTAAATRMTSALQRHRGVDALRAVLLESLPLDEVRRTEWSVWLAFWSQAAVDDSLRAENAERYAEWRELIGSLLPGAPPRGAGRTAAVDGLVALVDGLGIQATLAPDTMTPRRLGRAVDQALEALHYDR